MRNDVRRACVCLNKDDLEGALDALPSYRVPPSAEFDFLSVSEKCERETRQ